MRSGTTDGDQIRGTYRNFLMKQEFTIRTLQSDNNACAVYSTSIKTPVTHDTITQHE